MHAAVTMALGVVLGYAVFQWGGVMRGTGAKLKYELRGPGFGTEKV